MQYIKSIVLTGIIALSSFSCIKSMGDFNFDQMQNLQQELEEANRAIEEYISSLPPEEQAEFNQAVDELSQMFDSMSEDEFASFLNEMFTEEPAPMMTESFAPTSQPVMREIPILTTEQKKKVDNIITLINDLIRQSNIFLVQIGSSLETEKNINNWARKGSISNWQQGTEWHNLKFDIEKFVQQLYLLEDKDLTTQEYRYIMDLIQDESTLNNLIQLQTNLNSSVPFIEVSELDIQELSSQAKDAIKNTLQYFTEALYVLQLPTAINAIFEKYAPQATKLKEAEEAAEKKAAELAKRPKTPIGATTAGVAEESGYGDYGYGSYGGYDYGGGYGDYGYSPSYGGYDYGGYGGDYGYGNEGFGGGKEGKGSSGGGMGGGGGGEFAGEAGEKKPTTSMTTPHAAAPVKKPRIKKLVESVKDSLQKAAKIVSDNELFENIAQHIVSKDESTHPVSSDLENDIVKLNKELKSLKEEIESLQSMVLKEIPSTKSYYRESFVTKIEEPMETLTKLYTDLKTIKFKDFKDRKQTTSPQKEWAYFAGDEKVLSKIKMDEAGAPEKVEELKTKIPTRIPLEELFKTLSNLEDAVKTFKDKTQVEQTVSVLPNPATTQPTIPVE